MCHGNATAATNARLQRNFAPNVVPIGGNPIMARTAPTPTTREAGGGQDRRGHAKNLGEERASPRRRAPSRHGDAARARVASRMASSHRPQRRVAGQAGARPLRHRS